MTFSADKLAWRKRDTAHTHTHARSHLNIKPTKIADKTVRISLRSICDSANARSHQLLWMCVRMLDAGCGHRRW